VFLRFGFSCEAFLCIGCDGQRADADEPSRCGAGTARAAWSPGRAAAWATRARCHGLQAETSLPRGCGGQRERADGPSRCGAGTPTAAWSPGRAAWATARTTRARCHGLPADKSLPRSYCLGFCWLGCSYFGFFVQVQGPIRMPLFICNFPYC